VRHVVAKRLGFIVKLVSPKFCESNIGELALKLLDDSVADVRYSGFFAVGQVLKKLSEEESRLKHVLTVVTGFATKPNYNVRLMFVYIAQQVAENENVKLFETEFVDRLVTLSDDKIPNIRLAISRILSNSVCLVDSLKNNAKVVAMKNKLSQDPDPDVSAFASKPGAKPSDVSKAASLYRFV